jgi:hypothetical protein
MRAAIRSTLLGLAIVAIAGFPAGAAPGRHGPPSPRLDARAMAGRAVQGGTLLVGVQVRLPRGSERSGLTPSASAVVHFDTGEVSVDLTGTSRSIRSHRFGHRAWWAPLNVWTGFARVPVAADETPGRVPVDVTVAFGDGSVTVATFGRIRRARHQAPPPTTDPVPDPTDPCIEGCQEL